MDERKKTSITQIFGNVFHIVHKLVSDIFHLASAEARLAKQSLANIILLGFVFGSLFTSTWLCVLGLIVAFLMSVFQLSLLAAFAIVCVLNFILIAVCAFIFLKLKGNLSFRATRNQLSSSKQLLKDSYRARITAKN
ncbi:MAG: phage holin family protein [Pseudomonadota bacterium]